MGRKRLDPGFRRGDGISRPFVVFGYRQNNDLFLLRPVTSILLLGAHRKLHEKLVNSLTAEPNFEPESQGSRHAKA